MAGNNSKKNKITRAHDATFKKVFEQKEIAINVIENNLPAEVIKLLDMDSLEKLDGSFINEELKENFADIIYKVKINQKECYIVLLLEHKSQPDKLTAFQVARYIIELWSKEISAGKKEISVVIPIVIYHGKNKWRYETNIRELIPNFNELPDYIVDKLPVLEYELINVATHEEKEFNQYEPITRMILRSMKYVFYGKDKVIEELLISVEEIPPNIDDEKLYYYINILLIYFQNTGNEITEADLNRKIKELDGKGDKIMTILQAREQKGIEKGIQFGEIKKAKEMAANGITKGYDIKIIMDMTGLSLEEIEKIKRDIIN